MNLSFCNRREECSNDQSFPLRKKLQLHISIITQYKIFYPVFQVSGNWSEGVKRAPSLTFVELYCQGYIIKGTDINKTMQEDKDWRSNIPTFSVRVKLCT